MGLIALSFCVSIAGICVVPFLPVRMKGYFTLAVVTAAAILVSIPSLSLLLYGPGGGRFIHVINAGFPFGSIPLRLDELSAFFCLVISFTVFTGAAYGRHYMSGYAPDGGRLSLHWCSFITLQMSMYLTCVTQNVLAFLMVWELMTVSAFILVIYDHEKESTVRAGMNYFIQSHVGLLFLITGFLWASKVAGSLDLYDIVLCVSQNPAAMGPWPALLLMTGFSFKAGFIPLHTWLPRAHPAAPSHVSGVMSGVIIKMGIFGILRAMFLYPGSMVSLGRLILIISALTALYGVMIAIVQHNLKRLLAYHSIENIGIIGMGIGIGAIGAGRGDSLLAFAGYGGALLHVLNHSLFKSLLFYTAGTVYQKTHTLNVEELGGLMKKMPHTAVLFLIPALAICGLPPFNGFVSEFLVYGGLFRGTIQGFFPQSMLFLCSTFALVMVGGLAFLCFTKAFGVVFLGSPRKELDHEITEVPRGMRLPQYLVVAAIVVIGLCPAPFVALVAKPASLFIPLSADGAAAVAELTHLMFYISAGALGIFILSGVLYVTKLTVTRKRPVETGPTWGCGYTAADSRMQYTATSFVGTYAEIADPVLRVTRHEDPVEGLFPSPSGHFHIHTYDRMEELLIDRTLNRARDFLSLFGFLQNGRIQYYILYGVFFIVATLAFSFREGIISFIKSFFALG